MANSRINMTLQQAINIMQKYQQWRLGQCVDCPDFEMITEAIYQLVNNAEESTNESSAWVDK